MADFNGIPIFNGYYPGLVPAGNTAPQPGFLFSTGAWVPFSTSYITSGILGPTYGGTGVSSFGGTNTLLYTTAASTLSSISTANNGVLITSNTGTPSISSTLPSTVQGNITSVGTITSGTWNGTAIANANLAHATIVLGSTTLTLGNTTTSVAGLTLTTAAVNGTIGATTASTGAFTTLSASSTVSGTGFSTYLASPPSIGGTSANSGQFTTLQASGITTIANGSSTAPGLRFTASSQLGFYENSGTTIGFASGGSSIGTWNGTSLTVAGNIQVQSDNSVLGITQTNGLTVNTGGIQVTGGGIITGTLNNIFGLNLSGTVAPTGSSGYALEITSAVNSTTTGQTITGVYVGISCQANSGNNPTVYGINILTPNLTGAGPTAGGGYMLNVGAPATGMTGAINVTSGTSIFGGPVIHAHYTVSALPSASSNTYAIVFVTDSTSGPTTGIGTAPTGSGTNVRAVYSNGTSWLQM